MAIFSFRKRTNQPLAARKVRFAALQQSQARVKDPRTAAALLMRAPSPFPRAAGRPAKQYVVGGKSRLVVGIGKWRTVPRRSRPLLVEKGSSGVVDSSDSASEGGKEKEKERGRGKSLKNKPRYQLDARSRYERRDHFQPGDCVMVKVREDFGVKERHVWRYGVIADFNEFPPRLVTSESSLMEYPVTYDVGEERYTTHFSTMRCGILYDKLRSEGGSD